MKRILLTLLAVGAVVGVLLSALPRRGSGPSPQVQLKERFARKAKPSVDHAKFDRLKQPFKRPQDVTAACISCHNERHTEVMASSHWSWERTEYLPGKGIRSLGKKNVLNNFCIGISGNEQTCNKCHVGYGYGDANFDFKNPLNVDCLACHDNSATYLKAPGGAGMPDPKVDLNQVAQKVGLPQRTNCLTCHGFGGGGNNVKHGDLEKALFSPSRAVDVHMGVDGADMQCVACHTAEKHQMLGKMYSISSMNRDRSTCESCHSEVPHGDEILNKHTLKVACQTCHIPIYAKVNPTKLTWDWSTAGRLKDGQPFEEKAPDGTNSYASIKGTFTWGKNLKPEYAWSNGTASHYLLGDPVDPAKPVKLNELHGNYGDPEAKIIPVKVHRARQIYDTENKYLIQPKTVSNQPGDGGYWKEFNWTRASEAGMKLVNLPFSGKHDFIDTEMTWPINHMVSPKAQTVGCTECHTRQGGRLAKLTGFYLPGRDFNPWLEGLGKALVLLTLLGVLVHGGARMWLNRTRKEA
jgi:octaheme c-type cytochrome (tetrathionate reductase family)